MNAPVVPGRFMNIAHRGFSGRYPENTLLAFSKAIELGCTWLECDVRYTRDGHPVVIHDAEVDRTTDGTGSVSSLSLPEIRSLDAGGWKNPEFAGERVPTLEELLNLARNRARVVVELKCGVDAVNDAVNRIRHSQDIVNTVASAFEWDVLIAVRRAAPEWRATWLTRLSVIPHTEAIRRCNDAGISTFGPHTGETDEQVVASAHAAGLLVRCWGLGEDRGPEMRRLIGIGADGVTTNHPDVLMRVLSEYR